MTTQINLPFVTATQEGPKHLDLQLTRAKLEEITADLLERTVGPTKQALTDAGLDASKIDHVVLVGGMTRMPAVQEKVKELIGKDPHKGVNPDEVVAVGAAHPGRRAQGRGQGHPPARRHAALARHRDEGRRHDEADRAQHDDPDEEVRDRSRPPRTTSPRSRCTSSRASRRWRRYNKTLGKFQLVGIPPAPRGMPQVEVTFDIDANGIINVSAKDLGTGNVQQIQIQGGSGLSENEVQEMIRDAEAHADEARKLREARRREEPRRDARLPDRALAQGAPRQARRVRGLDDRGPDHGAAPGARGRRRRRHPREDGRAPGGLAQARRGGLRPGGAQQAQASARRQRRDRRPTTRSSRRASTRSSTRRRRPRDDRRAASEQQQVERERRASELAALEAERDEDLDRLQAASPPTSTTTASAPRASGRAASRSRTSGS